ncbi:hypothetical protein MP228_012426 [Amoeboaphelidium protococcarum]|nr:hypothetical protein MP228_012426 [Amoeboaphelidium protococcarum]
MDPLADAVKIYDPFQAQESQWEGFYLTRQRFKYLTEILLQGNDYIPSRTRKVIVQLLNKYDHPDRSLVDVYILSTASEVHINAEYRRPVLELLNQRKKELVDDGEEAANAFLLKNRQLNPKLLEFFRSEMKNDLHFSYPVSQVTSVPFEVTGSISLEDFHNRMRLYDPQEGEFIVYREGRRVDQLFQYGDPYNSNQCRIQRHVGVRASYPKF